MTPAVSLSLTRTREDLVTHLAYGVPGRQQAWGYWPLSDGIKYRKRIKIEQHDL